MKTNNRQIELEIGNTTWVRCYKCEKLNKITRAYYWSGKNKGKKKPLSNLLLCYWCDENMWDPDDDRGNI